MAAVPAMKLDLLRQMLSAVYALAIVFGSLINSVR